MKKIKYTCDKCKKEINEDNNTRIVGGGSLVTLFYESELGNNQFPVNGWHLHYICSLPIIQNIKEQILIK